MIPIIIVPTLNRYDLLEQMLDSVDYPVKNILIIDNGNQYKTDRQGVTVLNMPANLGMSASWNLGIKCYPHEPYWVFASADTIWHPGALAELDSESGPDKVIVTSDGYGCFSVGENIIDKVGLFDEYYYPIYFEDNDFNDKVVLEVGEHAVVRTGIMTHPETGSQTIHSDTNFNKRNEKTFVSNKEYYEFRKNNSFKESKQWSINRRRENEWLS